MYAVSFTMIPASGLVTPELIPGLCVYIGWITILGTVVLLLYPVYSTVLLLVV